MTPHPRPFYYLENFASALDSLVRRYDDLLSDEERQFIERFHRLPDEVRGLLVRMIGRRGPLFRSSRLRYEEIRCTDTAAEPLADAGWVDPQPRLTCAELFALLTKPEICAALNVPSTWKNHRKPELLARYEASDATPRTLEDWWPQCRERAYRVLVAPLCERLRIVFFGNFRQEWSEFVLADLGIFQYERVPIDARARAFRSRAEIEQFDSLFRCRQLLEQECSVDEALEAIPAPLPECAWLEARRARLLFRIAQQYERTGDYARALGIYSECAHPEARARAIRMLERLDRHADAYALFERARRAPVTEHEAQRLRRMASRLHRKIGQCVQHRRRTQPWPTFELALPAPTDGIRVERQAAAQLAAADAPVLYVENALINSLCGLLCWEAIFAPVPGAFFHDFHAAPVDLLEVDFLRRREREFAMCLAQLDNGQYRHTILATFAAKAHIASPFVAWGLLTRETLVLALDCIPAHHLSRLFARILADIGSNRTGLPDLVQFWPTTRGYRLIEVKGPGDRLQDNQIRWLTYCAGNDIPVAVCKVRWA